MYEELFAGRLAELRLRKGVSARDMSLSLGQNPGYINNIESGKALPSMSMFFIICDFLKISPSEFFDLSSPSPSDLNAMIEDLKKLPKVEFDHLAAITRNLVRPFPFSVTAVAKQD